MKSKLLVATVVLVGLGSAVMFTLSSHEPASSVEKFVGVLPEIENGAVTAIDIVKPNGEHIALKKRGEGWFVVAPLEAKADQPMANLLAEKLEGLEVASVAATKKENHARLQVDADKGIHVKVSEGSKLLADLWIGAARSGGTMVRSEGQDVVFAVRGMIRSSFDKELKDLRDRTITDVQANEFAALSIESAKGSFKFEKEGESGKWKQSKGEKPIAKFADVKVQTLSSTLGRLHAADFADPAKSPDSLGFTKPSAKATLKKKDGSEVQVELGDSVEGQGYYLRVVGQPVIYRVSKFTGEQMMADASAFMEDDPKDKANAPTAEAQAPGQNPEFNLQGMDMQALQRHMNELRDKNKQPQ